MLVLTEKNIGRHASISTVDLQFLGIDVDQNMNGLMDKVISLASTYAPLDGINDAGVSCGIYMTYQGGDKTIATDQNTDKPDFTSTTLLRLILDYADSVEEAVEIAEKELEEVKIEDEVTDVICEECGRNMVIIYVSHGKFLACPGFPECRNTKPYLEKIGVPCPVCGKEVVIRKTKKGRKYYGCEDNPECEFMSWQKPSSKKCPECGGYMVEKGNKLVCADEKCGYVETIKKED